MTHTLDELQTLCDAATPGWEVGGESGEYFIHDGKGIDIVIRALPEDLAFIATARTALPELVQRVRELESLIPDLCKAGEVGLQTLAERDAARAEVEMLRETSALIVSRDMHLARWKQAEAELESAERQLEENLAGFTHEVEAMKSERDNALARAEAAERRVAEQADNSNFQVYADRIAALESALRTAREVVLMNVCGCWEENSSGKGCYSGKEADLALPIIDAALAGEESK
jgi:hypothetical protein